MYSFKKVIKFNDEYFEHGNEVAVTDLDGNVTVGSIIISDMDDNTSVTTDVHRLLLDISEKYHRKTSFIYGNKIKNIQKINQ